MATGGLRERSNISLPVARLALSDRLVVVAIDIGTTFTGYCFGIRHEIVEDHTKIHQHALPSGAISKLVSLKVPSSVLFDKDQNFVAFGNEAEERYAEYCRESDAWDWYFVRQFKMVLYNTNELSRQTMLKDVRDRDISARKVFTEVINYLKTHFLDHSREFQESDCHWVITVPAIWSDSAKQFMREAAMKAGISTERLSLALEPEAAALFCINLPVDRVQGAHGTKIKSFKKGSKYAVLDIGGGTTDVTFHEVVENGNVKELAKANGGEWGGKKVEEEFVEMLTTAVGPDVLEIIQNNFPDEYLEILNGFEISKRALRSDSTQRLNISIPVIVSEQYKDLNLTELKGTSGKDSKYSGLLEFTRDKMKIQPSLFKRLFQEVCSKICDHLDEQFQELNDRRIDTIIMVGGFSESEIVQNAIKARFPDKRVIIPNEAGLSVLKGAVMFGFDPTIVKSRICRKTYGIQYFKHFEPALDPPEKRVIRKGHCLCRDAFDIHARVGDEFEVGEKAKAHEYLPSDQTQNLLVLNVYTSQKEYPMHIDEEGCQQIGEMIVNLNDTGDEQDLSFSVQFEFGDTELGVYATETRTGRVTEAKFEFLNRR